MRGMGIGGRDNISFMDCTISLERERVFWGQWLGVLLNRFYCDHSYQLVNTHCRFRAHSLPKPWSGASQSDCSIPKPSSSFQGNHYPGGWSLALEILWFNSLYSIYSFNIPFLNLVFSQSCMLWHRITISGVSSFWSRWRHALTTSRNGTKLNDDYIESATGWYHLLDG